MTRVNAEDCARVQDAVTEAFRILYPANPMGWRWHVLPHPRDQYRIRIEAWRFEGTSRLSHAWDLTPAEFPWLDRLALAFVRRIKSADTGPEE